MSKCAHHQLAKDCPRCNPNLIIDQQTELRKMRETLKEINDLIFAKGLLLGSDEYFKVRTLCVQHLPPAEEVK